MHQKELLTKEGLNLLREKLKMIEFELAEVSRGKTEAMENGGDGWHDNPAYEEIEARQKYLLREINIIKNQINHSKIVDDDILSLKIISIGSRARIQFDNKKEMEIVIGDAVNADPVKGVISYQSPLGKALLGARVGDKRNYEVDGKIFIVTIKQLNNFV